jgi:hypothetical protein
MENGFIAGGRAFLREKAEVGPAFPLDGAGVGLFLTEDEVEKRGLAGAIRADQAEAVGAGNEERDVAKKFARTVGLGDSGDREHVNGPSKRLGVGRVNPGVLAGIRP